MTEHKFQIISYVDQIPIINKAHMILLIQAQKDYLSMWRQQAVINAHSIYSKISSGNFSSLFP